jgi:hypothetical protein
MKEYKCIMICKSASETADKLNDLAKEGYKLICSYGSYNTWLIMEREKK